MEKFEKVCVGAVILLGMCGILGIISIASMCCQVQKEVAKEPVVVTKIVVEGPNVSWEVEKTNVVLKIRPSDLR